MQTMDRQILYATKVETYEKSLKKIEQIIVPHLKGKEGKGVTAELSQREVRAILKHCDMYEDRKVKEVNK